MKLTVMKSVAATLEDDVGARSSSARSEHRLEQALSMIKVQD